MDDCTNGANKEPTDSSGSNDSTLSLTQLCGLERYAVEERLSEMTDNLADMNWPTIGSQPIKILNTEVLVVM